MESHNIDKAMIENGDCVQMNPQGDLNIADCGDTAHLVCEYKKMTCEDYDDMNTGYIQQNSFTFEQII